MSRPYCKIWFRVLAAVILALAVTACSGLRNIRITSVSLESLRITSSNSLEASILVGVDNPSGNVSVSSLCAVLKYDGEVIANATAPDIELEGNSSLEYRLPCKAELADNISLLKAGMILAGADPKEVSADLSLSLTPRGGHTKSMNFKDLDLTGLLQGNE